MDPADERVPPQPARQRRYQRQRTAREDWPGYSLPLLGAYIVAPMLGFGLPFLATRITRRSLTVEQFGLGLTAFLLAPSIVHWVNGELELGFRALFTQPLVLALSAVATGLIGYAVASALEDKEPPCNDDLCDERESWIDPAAGGAALGGVIGIALGAIGWAMFDVYDATRRPSTAYAQFMIVPGPQGMSGLFMTKF